jgi:DNA-binding transcriptional LysR family regulator
MNKLMALQTFVRVAESGSFSSAASQLGISVSAVTKTIARLEDDLGTRLLERSTRKLALNDDGREYYTRAVQILNDVEDADAALQRGRRQPKGRIRMALPVLFARLTFLPRLAEFTARYPEVVLELRLDDRPLDLIEQGLDLAVVVGELGDSRHVARVLNRGPRITAAAASYIAKHGTPKTPPELLQHNCITSTTSPVWTFNDGGRIVEVAVRGNVVVTGGDAMRECALLGLGVVQSNWWTMHADLEAGSVVPLLEAYAVEGRPISVIYPSARHIAGKLRVLIDFLVEITRLPPRFSTAREQPKRTVGSI